MDTLAYSDQVDTIRTAFSYINRFKGHTFVIKIASGLFSHALFPLLIKDISLLHKMGIRIVLIPGARERINEILATYKIECRTADNVRITPEQAMPFVKMAAFDVSNRLMTLLAENDTSAIIGNWVKARGMGVVNGVNFQSSGTVEKLKIEIVEKMLAEGLIPIFPNIGWSATGKPYNISSNELAFAVSRDLQAHKLFFITDFGGINSQGMQIPAGVYLDNGKHITQLTVAQARAFFELNEEKKKTREYELLSIAYNACINGVDRVHIIDGSMEGMLLKEIFSIRGLGTMIYKDPYENIRSAAFADIADILKIMQPAIAEKILVPRTREVIEEKIADYIIYEVDDTPHACAALHIYANGHGEIAGLAVDKTLTNLGIGNKIVEYLLDKAAELGLKQVFVLTTQTEDWFLQNGFKKAGIADLPAEKQKQYNRKRNSLILVHPLASGKEKLRLSTE